MRFLRAKRDSTAVAQRKIYLSECRRFRIVRSKIIYGNGELPVVFYAEILRSGPLGPWWDILGKHRTRLAAEKAVEAARKVER